MVCTASPGWHRMKMVLAVLIRLLTREARSQEMRRLPAARHGFRAIRLIAMALTAGAGTLCHADPAVHVAFGRDYPHNINKYEIGLLWHSGFAWGNPQGWQTSLHWEVDLAQWDARSGSPRRNVVEGGFSPVLRFQKHGAALAPFLEASVGIRLMSHTSTSPSHEFSTAFRFTETIGFGLAFGPDLAAEAGFRFQHLSNGGIKKPNPGTDFITGYLSYRF